jgi:hypothetical protein
VLAKLSYHLVEEDTDLTTSLHTFGEFMEVGVGLFREV